MQLPKVPSFHLLALPVLVLILGLPACQRPPRVNENDLPVSHWLKDDDPCVRASAAAIIKSGRPYPNRPSAKLSDLTAEQREKYGIRPDEQPSASGEIRTTVDMWIGGTLFVVPGGNSNQMGYPERHPSRFHGLNGRVPDFYPRKAKSERLPMRQGQGPGAKVTFDCSMSPDYAKTWGVGGYRSRDEAIQGMVQQFETRLAQPSYKDQRGKQVTVTRRDDLGMFEIVMDAGVDAQGKRPWLDEAAYVPIEEELRSVAGSMSAIHCDQRYDPTLPQYGSVLARCTSSVRVTPNISADIRLPLAFMPYMPTVHQQVVALLQQAQQSNQ